jgi:hypothetical protein
VLPQQLLLRLVVWVCALAWVQQYARTLVVVLLLVRLAAQQTS